MDLVNHLEGRLLFAVPKKGRLNAAALNLLEGADIQFRRENRLDIALVKNLPMALIFLPAADIPTFVGEGRVDLGITGWDQVQEHDAGVSEHNHTRSALLTGAGIAPGGSSTPDIDEIGPEKVAGCDMVMELGFGACRLQVQVPQRGAYMASSDLVGKTIGTSFPGLTRKFFAKIEGAATPSNIRTKVVELSGSVEAACALGVADAIVDLVESGETMRAAGLEAIDDVVISQAVLIQSRKPSNPKLVELIASRIRGVITAQKYILVQYNVEHENLEAAKLITPGKRSPTVTSLNEEGWVAVSVMVGKKDMAVAMDSLAGIGAQDILVLDIHNSR